MITCERINTEDTYPIRHAVMWPDKPLSYIQLSEDASGLHFGLFKAEKLISVVSLFIKDSDVQFRKFATLINEQGKGYGTTLLSYVFDYIESEKINRVWCNARDEKTSYYQRFGMHITPEIFQKEGQSYVIMEKIL